MNLTNEKIQKDEKSSLYRIYSNETCAGDQIHALKFVNKTHTCYVLGDKNSKLFDEISVALSQDKNSTDKIYLEDLYSVGNISVIIDKVEGESEDSEMNMTLLDRPMFRSLASFHELNNNEINYRRNKLKRRYFDDDIDDDKLSKKERKKRKKRRKKLKKKEKELRKKRRAYKSPLEKLRSTIKWMACVEVSLAVCSCCLNLVQAVVIPFISPVPFGSRIQPVNAQFARGFEDYGFYGYGGPQQDNFIHGRPQFNPRNVNAHYQGCANDCRCNGAAGGGLGNMIRNSNGNFLGNNILQGMQQLRGNINA